MSEDRRHIREQEDNRPLAEMISAYLDDRESLSSQELARIELLLEEDPEARQMHAELGIIRQELRSLEPIEAPRAYHLTAEMVGAPEPVKLHTDPAPATAWYVRHTETVRWATAAAAVLFVFVLGADLILNNAFSDPGDSDQSAQTDQADVLNGDSDDADDDTSAGAGAADSGMEALEEDASDEAGDGEAAPPPVATPDVAEDAAGGNEETESGADTPGTSALYSEPENEEAQGDADATGPAPEAESARIATEDAAGAADTFALNSDETVANDASSDRRLWRIAEFGLVVLLGILITAMVVLPRLGRGAARTAND